MNNNETFTIRDLQNKAHQNAIDKGFYEGRQSSFGERLMLIVSELSEALEADRSNDNGLKENIPLHIKEQIERDIEATKLAMSGVTVMTTGAKYSDYKEHKGFELADALIRILDLAGSLGYDLQWYVLAKMAYNSTRPKKHGKTY